MIELTHFLAQETASGNGNVVNQIADTMNVSWPRLASQIFLFGIVLWTLKKFAFGPVEKILAERQKVIEQTLENSEKVRIELAQATATKKEILQKAETQAAEIIKQAQSSAETLAQRRLAEAHQEAEQIVVKSRAAMQIEKARLETELRAEILRLVALVTQRVTGKILTPEDQQRLSAETLAQVDRN